MNEALQSLWTNHRKGILIAAAITAVALIGYAFGRWAQPAKVVTVEHTTEVTVDTESTKLREELKLTQDKLTELQKHVHTEETETKTPDGKVVKTRTTDSTTVKVVHDTVVKYVDRDVVHETVKYVDREVLKEKTVEAKKPDWLVSPMIGVDLANLKIAQGLTTGPFVFGASVQRRVLGPIYVGPFGLSNGTVGVVGTLEF